MLFPSIGFCKETANNYQLEYGNHVLYGHSTYEIGGKICNATGCTRVFFPISRLEFPLNMLMVSVSYQKQFSWANLRTQFSHSIADNEGTFKDSDYFFAPGSLDIYSESTSNATALISSVSLDKQLIQFTPTKTFIMGIKFSILQFDFDVKDTYQVSNVPDFCTCYVAGPTITYKVTYYIPSIFTQMRIRTSNNIEYNFKHAFSPVTMVRDEDNHLARGKISKGELYGYTSTFDVSMLVPVNRKLNFILGLQNKRILVEGTQTQVQTGQLETDVDERILSTQWSLNMSFQSLF